MAAKKVRLLVEMTVYEGQFDAFDSIASAMIAGSNSETGTLDYEWYLSSDRHRCRLVETYADPAALAKHVGGRVVKELLPKLAEHCKIDGIEAYGDFDADLSATLTNAGALIFSAWQGLNR